ncbi:hypothetical protein A2V68_02215 [candidate division Kazan bacterium RBG_13_50_9]|uniref:GDP-mannose 4,6-dehydratase n=1 Tax=candidate division Kazan bacterium RBG_13_50_9 TaxID=1798535 RepID=A0A1F4NS97_UNCK3|nr:MAG: hypothetical protein A2V68_02215 [candidate division Kazan bacterium RBG_13_50_9]
MIALVTGITGQDGGYLAHHLSELGYDRVIGLVRRTSDDDPIGRLRLRELLPHLDSGRLILEYGDITDAFSLLRVFEKHEPDEVYSLAAQSHVARSFEMPILTRVTNQFGPLNILEALRTVTPDACMYQASTSEMYGRAAEYCSPQDENTPFEPVSPYGEAKLFAHLSMARARQDSVQPVRVTCGILFNHESARGRGPKFASRKVTIAAARIRLNRQEILELGNIDAERDWGYAPDYVEAMHLMLQSQRTREPKDWEDYVVATGTKHSVRELVEIAFDTAYEGEADLEWHGAGLDTVMTVNGVTRVRINPQFYRERDINHLLGNPAKAIRDLGWNPTRTSFEEMIQHMVEHDLAAEGSK